MKDKKIVVFGSYVTDLTSWAHHLPVPGETVKGSVFRMGPGGKGSNQGVAAHRAGANMQMVTKVGDDTFGRASLDFYKSEGMDTSLIFIDKDKETGTALIMVDENIAENQILVVGGACNNISESDVLKTIEQIKSASYILLQLEINMEATKGAMDIAYANNVPIVLNPAPAIPLHDDILSKITIITPNETEAEILTGIKVSDEESASYAAKYLISKGVKNVIITLGAKGAFVCNKDKEALVAGMSVDAVDTTGAGDAFNGCLVTALSEGMDLFDAAKFANVGAALSVTRIGTAPAMPQRSEIDEVLNNI